LDRVANASDPLQASFINTLLDGSGDRILGHRGALAGYRTAACARFDAVTTSGSIFWL
jgi:hypothetical protein